MAQDNEEGMPILAYSNDSDRQSSSMAQHNMGYQSIDNTDSLNELGGQEGVQRNDTTNSDHPHRPTMDIPPPIDIPPTYFCLKESDLGVPVYFPEELHLGDHVTWPRCCGYWHHAIVETEFGSGGNEHGSFEVVEMSSRCCGAVVAKTVKLSWPSSDGMYKIKYPSAVNELNPPGTVLERATEQKKAHARWNLMTNNCEHLATYCKTGNSQGLQIERRCWRAPCYNFIKIICLLLYVICIGLVYEYIDEEIGAKDNWVGLVVLPLTEVIRRLFTVLMIIFHDKQTLERWFNENEIMRRPGRFCRNLPKACRSAIKRKLMKSVIIISFMECALLFIRFVKPLSEFRKEQIPLIVGCLDLTAVLVGSVIGTVCFYWYCHMIKWYRCRCFRPENRPREGTGVQ